MALADLTARLRLNISDFASKVTEASKLMQNFSNRMNRQYGDAAKALTAHNMGLKDTGRIVQGILVSQAFYTIARQIREASQALWGFNEALDYAQITYSALFGSTELANDFMAVLKEHSVETIFDYEQLAASSKKLLAYGIDYKNLMFIMEGLTNLGAMSGDAAALDRIALALGQIYTRGKLSAEEMRQLANAYVPISDIVQKRFNLTPDQMGSIGDLNLPAHEVINAVVDYANQRFGDVGDAAMFTFTGLKNKIVDTFKVMGVEMLQPFNRVFKSFLMYVSKGLEGVREAYARGGSGGLFEHLVPDENLQKAIRQFLANIHNMFMTVASFGAIAGNVIKNFSSVFVTAFNIIAPVINIFVNAILKSLNAMMQTRAGALILRVALLAAASAFIVLKAHAVGALVITAVTKAVMGLAKALVLLATLVTRHPILMLLAGLTIALVGVSTASTSANKGLSGLFNTLSDAGGVSSEDIFPNVSKDIEDASDAADQFNNRLEGSKDAADGLADGLDKAGKKAKKTGDLLSFDEVFKLRQEEDSGGGGGSGVGNLGNAIGGLSDALIPDIPDFTEFIKGFTDGLFGGLKDSLLGNLALAGLGALLMFKILKALDAVKVTSSNASILKFAKAIGNALLGAFIGLGYDAIASKLTDKLWAALEEHFKLLEGSAKQASLGSTIGAVVGGAIGGIISGPGGALLGAAIGQFFGGLIGLLWDELTMNFNNALVGLGSAIAGKLMGLFGVSFKELIKLLAADSIPGFFRNLTHMFKIGGIKAIAKAGLKGLGIGLIIDAIAALFFNYLAERLGLGAAAKDTAAAGMSIGSIVGTIFGGILGGPAGAIIGSAIGTFVGGVAGLFWEQIKEFFSNPDVAIGANIGTTIGAVIGSFGGPIGTAIGALIGWIAGVIVGHFWDDIYPAIKQWGINTLKAISDWATNVKKSFDDWKKAVGTVIITWAGETVKKFTDWVSDVKKAINDWASNVRLAIYKWADETAKKITDWFADLKQGFIDWCDATKKKIDNWWDEVKTSFSNKMNGIKTNLNTWWSETKTNWSNKYDEIANNLSTWWNTLRTSFSNKMSEITRPLSEWWSETKTNWSNKYDEIATTLSTWWSNLKTSFSNKMSEITKPLSDWWTETKTNWSNKYNEIKDWLLGWWDNVLLDYSTKLSSVMTKLTKWFDDVKVSVSKWFGEFKTSITTWWNNSWIYTTWTTGWTKISGWFAATKTSISEWFTGFTTDIKTYWSNLWDTSSWKSAWTSVKDWFSTFLTDIGKWFTSIKTSIKSWWDSLWNLDSKTIKGPDGKTYNATTMRGHATGGIFNKEHIARFAEGNKAEAIIPLENNTAMQPFVDAVSNGLVGSLAPLLANNTSSASGQLPPMYVGTLIADERSLKQLYKRFEVIKVQEDARRGIKSI